MTPESRGADNAAVADAVVTGARFRDRKITVHAFADRILVACPSCGACARVFSVGDPARCACYGPWRLSCLACGYVRERAGRTVAFGGGGDPVRDPYFGLPLWLQVGCCGGRRLWAYNAEHLDFLEAFVAARLRERADLPPVRWSHRMTMVARLPAWLKSAKHRREILTRIARLRERAA